MNITPSGDEQSIESIIQQLPQEALNELSRKIFRLIKAAPGLSARSIIYFTALAAIFSILESTGYRVANWQVPSALITLITVFKDIGFESIGHVLAKFDSKEDPDVTADELQKTIESIVVDSGIENLVKHQDFEKSVREILNRIDILGGALGAALQYHEQQLTERLVRVLASYHRLNITEIRKNREELRRILDPHLSYVAINIVGRFSQYYGIQKYVDLPTEREDKPLIEKTSEIEFEGIWEDSFYIDDSLKYEVEVYNETVAEINYLPLKDITEATDLYPSFVLLGKPGSGKTTTLRYLAVDAAQKWLNDPTNSPIPVYLDLSSWGNSNLTIREYIHSTWPNELKDINLRESLHFGDIILYLDGLNEMGANGAEKAKQLFKWLHGGEGPEPKKVTITCREEYYDGDFILDIPIVLIRDMEEIHIRTFVHNYLDEAGEQFLERILLPIDNRLRKESSLASLAKRPYLLAVMIYLYQKSRGELPQNFGTLFRQFVTMLWKREEERATDGWVEETHMKKILAQLAYHMIDKDLPTTIPLSVAFSHARNINDILYVAEQAGFISVTENETDRKIGFFHEHFRDYFAAIYLRKNIRNIRRTLSLPKFNEWGIRLETRWDWVLISLSGIAPPDHSRDDIIEQIAAVDPFLATDCVLKGADVQETTKTSLSNGLKTFLLDISEDRSARSAAAFYLGKLGQPSVIPGLINVLESDPPSRVKRAIATALGEIGASASVEILSKTAYDRNTVVALASIKALGEIGHQSTIPILQNILENDLNPRKREAAATSLGFMTDFPAQSLLSALIDKSSSVRKAAANSLQRREETQLSQEQHILVAIGVRNWDRCVSGGAEAVPILLDFVFDEDPEIQQNIIKILGLVGSPKAISVLHSILADPSSQFHIEAVEALGEIGDPQSVPYLLPLIADNHMNYFASKNAILKIGESAIPILLDSLKSCSKSVFQFVTDVLETLGRQDIDLLLKLAEQETTESRLAVAVALSRLNQEPDMFWALLPYWIVTGDLRKSTKYTKDTIPLLLSWFYYADGNSRKAMVEIFGEIPDSRIATLLLSILQDSELQEAAIHSLSSLGAVSIPLLEPLLHHQDTPTRLLAIEILQKSQIENASEILVSVLNNPSSQVRFAAATALRLLDYQPINDEVRLDYLIAQKDWDACVKLKPRSIQRLTNMLSDNDAEVRLGVAQILKAVGHQESLPYLQNHLAEEKSAKVQHALIEAIGYVGSETSGVQLFTYLNSPYAIIRKATVEAIGNLKTFEGRNLVAERLNDIEYKVRRAAVHTLGKIGDGSIVLLLVNIAQDENSAELSQSVIDAIVSIGDSAIPQLTPILSEKYGGKVEIAVKSLGLIGTGRSFVELIKLFNETTDDIRISIITALGKSQNSTIAPVLHKIAEWHADPSRNWSRSVREVAIKQIANFQQTASAQLLLKILSNKKELSSVRIASGNALLHIFQYPGWIESLPQNSVNEFQENLLQLLDDGISVLNESLASLLLKLGYQPRNTIERIKFGIWARDLKIIKEVTSEEKLEDVVPYLEEALNETNLETVEFAAYLAGRLRISKIFPLLINLFQSYGTPHRIRNSAAYGLLNFSSIEALEALKNSKHPIFTRATPYARPLPREEQTSASLREVAQVEGFETIRTRLLSAIENNPNDINCWRIWANIEKEQMNNQLAFQLFAIATKLESNHMGLYEDWIQLALDQNNYDEIFTACSKAYSQNLLNLDMWQQWLHIERKMGHKEKVRHLLTKGVKRDKIAAHDFQNKARHAQDLGNFEQARTNFERAIATGNLPIPWQIWALMEKELENYEESRTLLEIATEKYPDDGPLYSTWAWLELENKNFAAALSYADLIVKINPENFYSYRTRGRVYKVSGNKQAAIQDLNNAKQLIEAELSLKPNNRKLLNLLCSTLIWLGEFQEAEKILNELLSLNQPPNANLHYTYYQLGELHEAQGDTSKAREYYELALDYKPSYLAAKKALKIIES